ncbi:MAG: lysophospholipid acyltransferase family protein [Pseudomonadota bacterium]
MTRSPLAHAIALVRGGAYSVLATLFFIAITLPLLWVFLLPPDRTRWMFHAWASADLWLLRVLCGQRVALRGRENIPTGPALVASKHQAAFETLALVPMLPRGAIIIKKELAQIPLYGAYAKHYGMIPVDRSAGAAALKQLAVDAKDRIEKGFQIVIFPEGTRQAVGAPPEYKPGTLFLYDKLKVPLVPVALNSGVFWPRDSFARYPGTIVVSFLPPIPAGEPRNTVQARLIDAIETETAALVAEATRPQD